MRILLPSATLAAFTSASTLVSATNEATAFHNEQQPTNDATISQVARDVNKSYHDSYYYTNGSNLRRQQRECNTHEQRASVSTDVGVLGCHGGEDEICVPDESSKLGGRCTTKSLSLLEEEEVTVRPESPVTAAFPTRRYRPKIFAQSSRQLQDGGGLSGGTIAGLPGGDNTTNTTEAPFVCPTGCPEDFCDCAKEDGDAEKCASELHSVCEQNLLPACVPDKYLTFYIETYCPFSKCLAVENQPYEVCSCGYYKNYCQVYYAYEQSIEKCAIGDCCDGKAVGEKFQCIPALEPTISPTGSPTETDRPSASPTMTTAPTISTAPTTSSAPSGSPTISTAPTISSMPTPVASDPPSGQPTSSSSPTTTPTQSPTTGTPTTSPTVSPTLSPSFSPSDAPSSSPTISTAPTSTFKPSASPTSTSAPTISSAPTDVPSTSTAPTGSPSASPTGSVAPTASPSSSPPTVSPSASPTDSPSDSPTMKPTTPPIESPAPTTNSPTKAGEEVAPEPAEEVVGVPRAPASSGVSFKSGVMASLIVGVGGALWLFA